MKLSTPFASICFIAKSISWHLLYIRRVDGRGWSGTQVKTINVLVIWKDIETLEIDKLRNIRSSEPKHISTLT